MTNRSPSFVAYTAIFGAIGDQLRRPGHAPSGRYIAFADVDSETDIEGWHVRPPVWRDEDPRLRSRHHKILSHRLFPEADYTLWVDGVLTPIDEIENIVAAYLSEHDLCTFRHRFRQCIYEEAEACIRMRKDDPKIVRTQVERYRQEGYPPRLRLAETTAVLRRQTHRIKTFNENWWAELRHNSVRDQLSFDYVAWKLNVPYAHFRGLRGSSPHFLLNDHCTAAIASIAPQ